MSGRLLMLGEPDPVVLAPGQTEPTIEQVAKAYARRSAVIENIAIEPSSVERITPTQRFGADMPSAKPLMRRLGYTAHPDACTHYRKRLMLGSTRWTCADCGVRL